MSFRGSQVSFLGSGEFSGRFVSCLAGQASVQASEATMIHKMTEVGERVFFAMGMWVLMGSDGFSSR